MLITKHLGGCAMGVVIGFLCLNTSGTRFRGHHPTYLRSEMRNVVPVPISDFST